MGCFNILKSKKKKEKEKEKPPSLMGKPCSFKEALPTSLPEPEAIFPSVQSAPPSFRNRSKISQPAIRVISSRVRALSAPSTLDVNDGEPLASADSEDLEEMKSRGGMRMDQRLPTPQPLPLPSPQSASALKNLGSFQPRNSQSLISSGSLPLPPFGSLRSFSFKEISTACHNFSSDRCLSDGISSTVYSASFRDDTLNKKLDATITRLLPSNHGFKEFLSEVNIISTLQHPQLCKLLGFYACEGSDQQMLVYERLFHGSLDQFLTRKSDSVSIDWASRIKVAICAAKGMAFLHEEGPFQAMYDEFSASNIQIDKDFSAKLSGYHCVSYNPDVEISNTLVASNLSNETLEKGVLTPKSNVWSFGIVLLELLTGRKNLDSCLPREERNLVKWCKPYLNDDCRLSLIMDSRLKGRYPLKAAGTVADIALKCLHKDPSQRPTMRTIVDSLESIQDMKYSCRFPLLEQSGATTSKQMLRSPSLNGTSLRPVFRGNFSRSPPLRNRSSVSIPLSPPRLSVSISLPSRTCASTVTLEDYQGYTSIRSPPRTSYSIGRA